MTSLISRHDPFYRIILVAFYSIGGLFFVVGVGLGVREFLFGMQAIHSIGTIVEVRVSESADGPNFIPVVQFPTQDGENVQFEGVSTSPAPIRGTAVPVLYSPKSSNDARIDTFTQRWLFPALFTPLGAIMVLSARFNWFGAPKRPCGTRFEC